MTFSPQRLQPDGHRGVPASERPARTSSATRPRRSGVTTFRQGTAPLPPQSPRIISPDYQNPYTWQSSIGFQKQINPVTGFEADLTHFNEYSDTRTIDPNLFYNPATGYNVGAVGGPTRTRPIRSAGYFVATGQPRSDAALDGPQSPLQEQFPERRDLHLMLSMHDDGNIGYTAPRQNNQFDYLDGEYATSTDFQQQHAPRCGRCTRCRGASRRACRTSTVPATALRPRSRRRRTASPGPTA